MALHNFCIDRDSDICEEQDVTEREAVEAIMQLWTAAATIRQQGRRHDCE